MVTDEFKSVIAGLSPAVILWQMNPAPLLSTFDMSPVFCNVAGVSLTSPGDAGKGLRIRYWQLSFDVEILDVPFPLVG